MTLQSLAGLAKEVLRQLREAAAAGFDTRTKLRLATSPSGRIVLHLVCAWRDHRYQWHWRGVARELART